MLVRDIMSKDLTTLQENEFLLDAVLIFSRASLRHVPILRDKQLVGIVTERDLKHYSPSILSGISPDEYNRLMATTPLSKIMTRELITVEPGASVYEALQALQDRRIGCLPVVEEGELRGIITTTDMLKLLSELLQKTGEVSPGAAN